MERIKKACATVKPHKPAPFMLISILADGDEKFKI